jgi:hypothetical protein
VVFVISPDSVASETCRWEVARTLELGKALVPLLWRAVPDGAVPAGLAARNYVFFDAYERSGLTDEAAFAAAMGRLQVALTVAEALWVREHTRWVARAAEWDKPAGADTGAAPPRPEGKLLPPGDLAAAEAWARLRPPTAPEVPPVLADYLRESREKHERDSIRQRRIIGRAFVKPALQALEDGLSEHTLRLAAAGVLLAKDLDFDRRVDTQLWEPAMLALLEHRTCAVLKGHSGRVIVAAFSPDGRRIVAASDDNSARLWDAATGQQIPALQGHSGPVWSASFSPDGQRIVTASSDNSARLWDAATGKEIATLQGHTDSILSAAFGPDGERIVTASWDHTARLWDVSRSATIMRSQAIALTAALARGIGRRTDAERADLLMQDAPDDLFAEARRQLLDPEKYSPEQIARRERLLEQTIAELRAPLHPNCYLSPSQFAEKFGLAAPFASAGETGSDSSPSEKRSDPSPRTPGSDPSRPSGDIEHERRREGSDPIQREGSDPAAGAGRRNSGATATAVVLLGVAAAVVGGLAVVAMIGRALLGWSPW